ncbi:Arm DNA-binding domain-containing protein [Cupriavidus necator]
MDRDLKLPVGVRVRKHTNSESLQIAFSYHGVECREALRIEPTAKNIKFAERLRSQILLEIEKGTFNYGVHFPDSPKAKMFGTKTAGNKLLGDYLDEFMETCRRGLAHSSVLGYQRALNAHYGKLQNYPIRDVTPPVLREWIAGMKVSAKRVRNVLTPLRGAIALALQDRHLTENPLDLIEVARVTGKVRRRPPYEINPCSLDEIQKILASAHEPYRYGLQLAFFTGMRTSELIALEWEQVDFDNWTVRVDRAVAEGVEKDGGKTEAALRTIELIAPARDAIERLKEVSYGKSRYVVTKPHSKDRYSDSNSWSNAWQRVIAKAEVTRRNSYQTRHTFASLLLSQGENPLWVARQMGHKNTEMIFKRYGRWISSDGLRYQPVSQVATLVIERAKVLS